MGQATSEDNEAKSKMKHPSDMPMPILKLGWSKMVWHTDIITWVCPLILALLEHNMLLLHQWYCPFIFFI